jgi:hypothetical protein
MIFSVKVSKMAHYLRRVLALIIEAVLRAHRWRRPVCAFLNLKFFAYGCNESHLGRSSSLPIVGFLITVIRTRWLSSRSCSHVILLCETPHIGADRSDFCRA